MFAPWVPGPRHDVKITMPPPPGGEVGGTYGVSRGYSDRLARTPYWKRMALTTYPERMKENETTYPFSAVKPDEYDLRYTPRPYPDHHKHRPLLEVGEAHTIPALEVPVIFLVDLYDTEAKRYFGRKYETVYVRRSFARGELIPQRYAIYATPEAYELLGLPVTDHRIHDEIPKNRHDLKKRLERIAWEEEPWKYTIESLFKKYEAGPPELLPQAAQWDGEEEVLASGGAGATGAAGAGATSTRTGPIKQRKARKVKLF